MKALRETAQYIKDIYIKEPQNSYNSETEAVVSLICGLSLSVFGKTHDLKLAGVLFLAGAGNRKKGMTNIALTVLGLSSTKWLYKNFKLPNIDYIKSFKNLCS